MAKFPKTPFEACLGDFPKHLKNDQKGGLLGRGWKSEGEVPSKYLKKGKKGGWCVHATFLKCANLGLLSG